VFARVAFAFFALMAVAMLALNVLAWTEYLGREEVVSSRVTTTARDARAARDAATLVARKPQRATVVLTARRGACWLSIRRHSSTGKRLYLGILRRGRSLEVSGPRIWMRVGAGENLVVRVNGRQLADFPEGIAEVAVTSDGLSRV
jgi:hypothetical protein